MAIQKKSLISNRTATKKALVAKPEATKTGITRQAVERARLVAVHPSRVNIRHRVVTG